MFLGDQVLEPKLTLTTLCALPAGRAGVKERGRRQRRKKMERDEGKEIKGRRRGERREQKREGTKGGGEGNAGQEARVQKQCPGAGA